MTAVQINPALLKCNRQSLLGAFMQAAQDGLIPDGRYGVVVPYTVNVGTKQAPVFEKHAQWMPMILGVYQKLHNSGKIRDISAHVVYENDDFEAIQGDGEEYRHRPNIFGDRGKPIGVYAIAHTFNGTYREAMSIAEVEKVREMSKSPGSPAWTKSWAEMAKVKVVKRLAKRLPLSTDNLDWLYREEEPAALGPPKGQAAIAAPIDWDASSMEADANLAAMNEAPDLPADVEPAVEN
jgi:recombination protein RecT